MFQIAKIEIKSVENSYDFSFSKQNIRKQRWYFCCQGNNINGLKLVEQYDESCRLIAKEVAQENKRFYHAYVCRGI